MNGLENERFCVIGAGPAGLTAIKNLRQRGMNVECFEARSDIGGLWNLEAGSTAVYPSVSMITSKRLSSFVDHPMPRGLPPFPNQQHAIDYLRSYADRFGLRDHISCNSMVSHARPIDRGWEIQVEGHPEPRIYQGVIVASGHHWDPLWPEWQGTFGGRLMHSSEYDVPADFQDQRVLIVGAGNSGCDIASEVSRYASRTLVSMRRGYYFLPKFLGGAPIDRCGEWLHRFRLPKFVYRTVAAWWLQLAVGSPSRYGLPNPDHQLFEAHPIINSRFLDDVGHGRIQVKPDIKELCNDGVTFVDDTMEEVDVIICATGYRASFPFLHNYSVDDLYLKVFDRQRDDFFVIGLIQPNGSIWPLADYQAQLVSAFLAERKQASAALNRFRKRKVHRRPRRKIAYLSTERHRFEIEYFGYLRELRKELASFKRGTNRK